MLRDVIGQTFYGATKIFYNRDVCSSFIYFVPRRRMYDMFIHFEEVDVFVHTVFVATRKETRLSLCFVFLGKHEF